MSEPGLAVAGQTLSMDVQDTDAVSGRFGETPLEELDQLNSADDRVQVVAVGAAGVPRRPLVHGIEIVVSLVASRAPNLPRHAPPGAAHRAFFT